MTDHDLLSIRWYAQPDDLIGGWCLMSVDKPPSRCSYREWQVSSFLDEVTARHVAELHNGWLAERAGGSR